MPFVGTLASSGERVDIMRVEHPREMFAFGDVLCPLCECALIVKDGLVRVKHFAHQARCSSPLARPESAAHLLGKWYIAERVSLELPRYTRAEIEYEVILPEVGRVADVLVTFEDGWRVAHECQLASITTGELHERTASYEQGGIDVIWWLGGPAATKENLTWCVWKQSVSHTSSALRLTKARLVTFGLFHEVYTRSSSGGLKPHHFKLTWMRRHVAGRQPSHPIIGATAEVEQGDLWEQGDSQSQEGAESPGRD